MERLENCLEKAQVTENTPICFGRFVAFLHKPKGPFKGLKFYANETEVRIKPSTQKNTSHSFSEVVCTYSKSDFKMCISKQDFDITTRLEPIVVQYKTYTGVMWKQERPHSNDL